MRIALPPAIDTAALTHHDRAAVVRQLTGESMGTSWQVKLAGGPAKHELRAAIEAGLAAVIAEMSHWQPQSLLSRFNRAPAGTSVQLPEGFAAVMAAAMQLAADSGGAFDPAIGHLVDLWGFGPPGKQPPPDAAAIATARRQSGWQRLRFDAGSRRLWQPGGVALDLSAIAKGHAVDRLADSLGRLGVHNMLVEIGGELVGRGLRPDGDPWWVDLEVPPNLPDPALEPLRVALHGMAVATSGNYLRGNHNIDPRSGLPAGNGVAATSVIASSAMLADGRASALYVLGPAAGLQLADAQHWPARWVMADGREILSPALAAMLGD